MLGYIAFLSVSAPLLVAYSSVAFVHATQTIEFLFFYHEFKL